MNRKEIKNFESQGIQPGMLVVAKVNLSTYNQFKNQLHRPVDDIFNFMMKTVGGTLGRNVDGCYQVYVDKEKIFLFLNLKINNWKYFGRNSESLASYISSLAAGEFNLLCLQAINDYGEKIMEENALVDDEVKVSIYSRMDLFSAILESLPVFITNIVSIPFEIEKEYLNLLQNDCIDRSIVAFANHLNIEKENKKEGRILYEISKFGTHWEDASNCDEHRYGVLLVKNESGDFANIELVNPKAKEFKEKFEAHREKKTDDISE